MRPETIATFGIMSDRRIHYLDGLRGILAVIVFVHHFFYAFYPDFIFGGSYESFFSGQWTIARVFAFTPLNLLFNPTTAINFFFLLSGYVQSWHYFQTSELLPVQRNFIKRHFRLAIPTLVVVLLVYAFHRLQWIDKVHFPPNPLTQIWIKSMMPDSFNLSQAIWYGMVDCFTSKTHSYQVLWTMPTELYNSWMVLILLMLTHRIKNKIWLFGFWFFVQLIFLQSFYGMSFTLGLILSYLSSHSVSFNQLFSQRFLKLILLLIGLYFASYPFTSYQNASIHSMYRPISFFDTYPVVISYAFGNLLLFCVILHSNSVQRVLSNSIFQFFGDISFMFYLVHFLLLFSFSPWLFYKLFPAFHNSATNYLITGISSFILITGASYLLYKFVDLPVVKACNAWSKRLFSSSDKKDV